MTHITGLELPRPWRLPEGVRQTFEIVRVHADTAYIAGHGPVDDTEILMHGKVGDDLTIEDGYRSAQLTALAIAASLQRVIGTSSRSRGCVRRCTSMPFLAWADPPSRVWRTASAM